MIQKEIVKLYRLFKHYIAELPCQTIVVLLGLNLAGCASVQSVPDPVVSEPVLNSEPTPDYKALQDEIERLEKVLAEKDQLILSQNIRQQDQDQVLQEATNEVARAQVKLHRLATKPSTASTIAEVEVAMESMKQDQMSVSEQAIQVQAQRLLDAATLAYTHAEYAAAMNYASQAFELINLVADKNRKAAYSDRSVVTLNTPIMLRTKTEVNLRKGPNTGAAIHSILKKGTILGAIAYRGNWLRVQTEEENEGWVFNTFVETDAG